MKDFLKSLFLGDKKIEYLPQIIIVEQGKPVFIVNEKTIIMLDTDGVTEYKIGEIIK